ncbi:hypothetical protein [Methanococcus maripaludis]|uniref:Uncharacterized protein n=1 Tax=Methanococcus maripaludis TaxID=39152 RepID=A0A7J9SCG5_METMI|nr:hypothetical protein [Methanococcus maripaludis]MBB6495984.1 hypothetical protein [Methanococcus maripaludis]
MAKNTCDRTIEAHWIFIKDIRTLEEYKSREIPIDNILNLFYRHSLNLTSKGIPFKASSDKIFWMEKIKACDGNDENRNILIKYLNFNKKYPITNVLNLKRDGEMDKYHGGEHRQHIMIIPMKSMNRALLLIEKVSGGISTRNIYDQLNDFEKYLNGTGYIEKLKLKDIGIKNVVSLDYLKKFGRLDWVSEINLELDRKKMSKRMGINFTDKNSRDSIVITSKPKERKSFDAKGTFDLVKGLLDNNPNDPIIKKIIVRGKDVKKEPVVVNTEVMKLKRTFTINLNDDDGLVNTEELFSKFESLADSKEFREELSDCTLDLSPYKV